MASSQEVNAETLGSSLISLADFRIERILSEWRADKKVVALGEFQRYPGQKAIITFTKTHFSTSEWDETFLRDTRLEWSVGNNIYGQYSAHLPSRQSITKLDIIFPCTEDIIKKHLLSDFVCLRETPELYAACHVPYIASIPPAALRWVYNIIDKTAEAERLLLEDTDESAGFVMHPDTKWLDQSQVDLLYCLVICRRRDISSLRELRGEHLPLLENIRQKCTALIDERFGVKAHEMRVYVHYPPSYYHFHLHFTHVKSPINNYQVGRAHLLDDIIDNIRCNSLHYQQRAITAQFPVDHPVWQAASKLTSNN